MVSYKVLMVPFEAEFHFLQHGTTTTLYDALTFLPWPYAFFHFGFGANYFWSQLFNIALTTVDYLNLAPSYFRAFREYCAFVCCRSPCVVLSRLVCSCIAVLEEQVICGAIITAQSTTTTYVLYYTIIQYVIIYYIIV